jgi:hypothetical protein
LNDRPPGSRARILGACLQGLILGTLLLVAIVQLASSEVGARVFRYQGF